MRRVSLSSSDVYLFMCVVVAAVVVVAIVVVHAAAAADVVTCFVIHHLRVYLLNVGSRACYSVQNKKPRIHQWTHGDFR